MVFLPEFLRKIAKKLEATYDHCSTQVDLPEDLAKKIIAWGNKNVPDDVLKPQDNGKTGREEDIHVTVLYGLKSDKSYEEVKKYVEKYKPFEIRLGLVSAFMDDSGHDVLKIDVESPELVKLHYLLEKNISNDNSYPQYQPHVTLAYLKKGYVLKYLGEDIFRDKKFVVNDIYFCSKEGKKTKVFL